MEGVSPSLLFSGLYLLTFAFCILHITLPTKVCLVKAMVFPVVVYGCGEGNGNPLQYSCLENPMGGGAWWAAVYGVAQSWTQLKRLGSSSSSMYRCKSWTVKKAEPKNWCFWTVVLEKTLESPLDCKETQPVHPKGNQSWIFIGRTDAETLILWPPDVKNWFIWKDPDAGKDWRREEKGTTEDEMLGWYHWLDGHEFEQAPGVGDGQGGLVCCSPWVGHDWATELNWSLSSCY